MSKKNIIIVVSALVLILALAGLRFFSGSRQNDVAEKVIGVSQFTTNTPDHLGRLTVQGIANQVFAEDGYFMLADPGGCCQIPVYVPFSAEQLAAKRADFLYAGTMPKANDWVLATGTLEKRGEEYVFIIEQVEIDNKVTIKKR